MTSGFSLFLIAVGAILAWGVTYTVTGIDIAVVGAILIIVGIIGLCLSLLFWESFSPFADRAPIGRRRVIVREAAPQDTTVVHEVERPVTRERLD
jgi:hypothetical protein